MSQSIRIGESSCINNSFFSNILPVRRHELIKFIPIAMMMFIVLLNQNLMRGLKDGLLITLIGPEIISFIQLFLEMPAGILFVIIYGKLCNMMSTEKVFRLIVCIFTGYFFIFAFFMVNNLDSFHPDYEVINAYVQLYPHLKWIILMYGKWTIVTFFMLTELWQIIIFCLLFWELANKITSVTESTRFYPLLALFGHSNLLISGKTLVYFAGSTHFMVQIFSGKNVSQQEITFKSITTIVVVTALIILGLHSFITLQMKKNPKLFLVNNTTKTLHLGLKASIKTILSSKYLGMVAALFLSYHILINIFEGLWNAKAKQAYNTIEGLIQYQGNVFFFTGAFTLFACIFGGIVVRTFGWFWGALATPFMMFASGAIFFLSVVLQQSISEYFQIGSFLSFIVFMGGLQNVLSRGTKYSLFDSTKEMTYIPLAPEIKTKGKAAVDVIGAKVGKSIAAGIQFLAFTIFPNAKYDDIALFLFIIYTFICLLWMYNVKLLDKEYQKLVSNT